MLRELNIKNFKLLGDVTLSFQSGMWVLTGETGAGKTQCLEALVSALGARSGDDAVASSAENATVTAVFDLKNRVDVLKSLRNDGWLDDGETEIILERTIEKGGRSTGRLNGRRVPLGALQDVADKLVDLLGQHARADILNRPALEILDSLGDRVHLDKLNLVREKYSVWQDAKQRYDKELAAIERSRERRDLVEFQHAELDKADLFAGEEAKLSIEHKLLESAKERIGDAVQAASILTGGDETGEDTVVPARDILQQALDAVENLAEADPALKGESERLREMVILLEELADTLNRYAGGITDDPERRLFVEQRISTIHNLKRKYKTDEAGLIKLRDNLARELELVDTASDRLKDLAKLRDMSRDEYLNLSRELSKAREKLSKRIAKEVIKHLADLDLPSARFEAAVTSSPDDEKGWRPDGVDRAELLISTNPEQELMPLKKAASGGELSRLLIALKTVLAMRDRVPVLVFDEAEAGIGGETAFKVGEKLLELSKSHQLILVSHLPQIASQGDGHWVIEKSSEGGSTKSTARFVKGKERVDEIGRMLGARGDKKALEKLARSFLKKT